MRNLLQVIGASLLLTGSILFFFPSSEKSSEPLTKEIAALEKENVRLKQKIKQLENEQKEREEQEQNDQVEQKPKATIKTIIAIEEGSDSTTVAKSLEEAKIIDEAKAFNDYLVEKGYASNIRIGEYEIHEKMTFKQIAETITKKENKK